MAQSVSISMSSQGIVEDEQRTAEVRALGQPAERASRLSTRSWARLTQVAVVARGFKKTSLCYIKLVGVVVINNESKVSFVRITK